MAMTMTFEKNCPVCSSADIWQFMQILQVPVYCNVLLSTRTEALGVKRGDLCLGFCRDCGHVFNLAFQPELLEYSTEYENSLHYSPRFQNYAETLAADLVQRHGLQNRTIIEIGCGQGDFLRLLCRLGGNRGVGFDPSYEPVRNDEVCSEDIHFVQEYFGADQHTDVADFVCCRHALEHISAPTQFLRGLQQTLGDASKATVFFEVPNGLYTFRDLGIWDLIYEHCSYFWTGSLKRCFELSGFKVENAQEAYGRQFIGLDASLSPAENSGDVISISRLDEVGQLAVDFKHAYDQKVSQWTTRLDEMRAKGTRVALWGGGSKSGSFLNVLNIAEGCPYVVDINPKKHGKFIPGTGQEIISPEGLVEYQPEVIILMNQIYENEVREQLNDLGVKTQILLA